MGDKGTCGVEVFGHVTVAIVGWIVGACAVGNGEKSADTTGSLHGAAEISAPCIGFGKCGRDAHTPRLLGNRVPAVIDIYGACAAGGLCNSAGLRIIHVAGGDAVDYGGSEPILAIPDERAVGTEVCRKRTAGHVAVGIILRIDY